MPSPKRVQEQRAQNNQPLGAYKRQKREQDISGRVLAPQHQQQSNGKPGGKHRLRQARQGVRHIHRSHDGKNRQQPQSPDTEMCCNFDNAINLNTPETDIQQFNACNAELSKGRCHHDKKRLGPVVKKVGGVLKSIPGKKVVVYAVAVVACAFCNECEQHHDGYSDAQDNIGSVSPLCKPVDKAFTI